MSVKKRLSELQSTSAAIRKRGIGDKRYCQCNDPLFLMRDNHSGNMCIDCCFPVFKSTRYSDSLRGKHE